MMSRIRGNMMSGKTWLLGACLLALMLVLGACAEATGDSEDVSARQTGDELSGDRSGDLKDRLKRPGIRYEPCGAKTCGDYCTICDPNDRNCYETAVVKYCNADGACSPSQPFCEETPEPPVYEPCAGKTCGDYCTICDPNDSECNEIAVVKYCDADGGCSMTEPVCEGTPEPPAEYEPCEGKTCGDYCTICDPNDSDCYETAVVKYCDRDGACSPHEPLCMGIPKPPVDEYEPCAGKLCGARCTVCDPNDRNCYETAVLKFCGSDGTCSPRATCAE